MIRPRFVPRALVLAATAVLVSCGREPTAPTLAPDVQFVGAPLTSMVAPAVVISQVYGGGGNSGAIYKNDFIELFNPGTSPVSLSGWSVQYQSSAGTSTWQVTALSGTIQPGAYYLVQQAAGAGAQPVLPTPDASGAIAMSASQGKVWLLSSTTALVGSCPTSTAVADQLHYGVVSVTCGLTGTTNLANATAAIRNTGGCTYTGPTGADFTVAAPTPRNSASPTNTCSAPPVPASVAIAPDSTGAFIGATAQFTASAKDASNNPVGTTFTWASSDNAVATVSPSGLATGVAAGLVTITATSANGIIGTAKLSVTPAPPPSATNVRITEIHYDNTGADVNEQVELIGDTGGSLNGWSLVLYNETGGAVYATIPLTAIFPASCGTQGVAVIPTPGIQNGPNDGLALVNSAGAVVEFLSYEGTLTAQNGPAVGQTSTNIGVSQSGNDAIGRSLLRAGDGTWYGPAPSSFGTCNPATKPVFPNSIFFSGRVPTDPALPVGFEDQLFATLRDGLSGATIPSTFTWTSETPAIATIDALGVMHALSAGSAVFRATAADGTTATWTLPTIVAQPGNTAQYGNNTEFGDPVDADASDDFIVRRAQFTTSFNRNRGIPNWVAYNLEATHIGTEVDRCDCFTYDSALPASFPRYTTADYTGAGTFHGYGIDRGHLARSFDRTTGALDNAYTYLFSNIIPQAADNNQGPWAILENYLGAQATAQNKEVYIIAGASGNKGTVKNEGKMVIPEFTWKVALLMPRDQGLAHVLSYNDVEVIAVILPNEAGIRNVDWNTYRTTVDAVEALSGYDLLSLLPDKIENAVESNTKPPVGSTDGPYTGTEGSAVSLSGAASVDYNGTITSYDWSFGDGMVASGANVTHTYAQDGLYTVRLIVTDNDGLADTVTTTAAVGNVLPTVAAFAGATLLPGESYNATGGFADPGADTWSATVNYGDGTGTASLGLSLFSFALTHTYSTAGTFTVTVRVSDDDGTTPRTQLVVVMTHAAALDSVAAKINALVSDGEVSGGNGNSLLAKVSAAAKSLEKGNVTPALNQLNALLNEIDAMEESGRLSATDATALRTLVTRIRTSLLV